ncbi:MAG: NmrA family NAD(P)-binding protein, partial [Mycobacteriaceae bacterium]|nr:NmrA family NAD(P)-binding protein [Mycobacteriaceae bacterium]
QRHGVEHIVFTGVAALTADRKWITDGKQRIEQAITASGLRHTILRPVRFMENWLATDSVLDGFTDGVNRHVFAADKPVQSIAVEDIGAIAALTFADPNRFAGQELELAGDAVTPAAAVAAIAEATGRPLRYHRITRGEAAALGSAITTAWEHAQAGQGWHVDIPAVRALYPNLTTFDSWLATTGAAALQSLLNA